MSLFDGIIALGVLGTFGWVILTRMAARSPRIREQLQSLFPEHKKIQPVPFSETVEQTYNRRLI